MRDEYSAIQKQVAELVAISMRRPLTPKQQDLLMILLNMMRMICDSPGIMKNNPSRDCPKLDELARVLDECLADPDVKIIIFSEWIGMLERVREWADKNRIGYAWHTGSVPQKQRRAEILAFRQDPDCRLFLSTDSGGVGLNLQNASVVINCDLPWNPAKLEQRIARAWRKNQLLPVTVVNLVAENTIEHGMLASLSQKMELAQGVLDGTGDLADIKLRSGRQAFLKRLDQVMSSVPAEGASAKAPPADPAAHFASRAKAVLGNRLAHCDETWVPGSPTPILMCVLQDSADRPRIDDLFREIEWRGDKPTLQILDASTWHALENLAAAGMISIHTRATRPLLPAEGIPTPPPLTQEQLTRIEGLRALAARKRRAAEYADSARNARAPDVSSICRIVLNSHGSDIDSALRCFSPSRDERHCASVLGSVGYLYEVNAIGEQVTPVVVESVNQQFMQPACGGVRHANRVVKARYLLGHRAYSGLRIFDSGAVERTGHTSDVVDW